MLHDAAQSRDHHRRAAIARAVGLPAPGADAIRPPPPAPRRQPVLPALVRPEAITSGEERFRCSRLECKLTAERCVERQQLANGRKHHKRKMTRYQLSEAGAVSHFPMCKRCLVGRGIAARLGVEIVESTGNSYFDDERFRGVPSVRAQYGRRV